MKSSDEIKKGLECDPLALIRQLYADNCRLKDELYNAYNAQNEQLVRINQLEAERDAAVAVIRQEAGCSSCLYSGRKVWEEPCLYCEGNERWEWRGVQKEESPC